MKIIAIVQARTLSKRLPRKVLKPLGASTVIGVLLSRLSYSQKLSQIVVATSENTADDLLAEHIRELGFSVYRGAEDDVLHRILQAATIYEADIVVRITGDCPLVDPKIVDKAIAVLMDNNCDYVSNVFPPTYPDGLDVEVFRYSVLE